jgi:hypothetical protein
MAKNAKKSFRFRFMMMSVACCEGKKSLAMAGSLPVMDESAHNANARY